MPTTWPWPWPACLNNLNFLSESVESVDGGGGSSEFLTWLRTINDWSASKYCSIDMSRHWRIPDSCGFNNIPRPQFVHSLCPEKLIKRHHPSSTEDLSSRALFGGSTVSRNAYFPAAFGLNGLAGSTIRELDFKFREMGIIGSPGIRNARFCSCTSFNVCHYSLESEDPLPLAAGLLSWSQLTILRLEHSFIDSHGPYLHRESLFESRRVHFMLYVTIYGWNRLTSIIPVRGVILPALRKLRISFH